MIPAGRHRDFPGRRWVINGLRVAHLVGVVGVGASVVAALPPSDWQGYAFLLAGSGISIVALDWWSNSAYPRQVNGLGVGAKLVLLGWFLHRPEHREAVFWSVLAFSVLMSHAPSKLRHRVWWHRSPSVRRTPRSRGP